MANQISGPLSNYLNTVARQVITRVEVQSNYGPPMVIDDPFSPGPPNPYLEQLKPKITIYTAKGVNPLVMSPYGNPKETKWPLIKDSLVIGGIVAGSALLWLTIRALRN